MVTATGEKASVNMISAVSSRGQLHFDLFEGSMTAARFIEFCQKLLHDCATAVLLIVDGSSAHTAHSDKDYVVSTEGRLQLFFLPPYSSELNPDEWVWKNVKHGQVKRAVPLSRGHLWTLAREALFRLQKMPETVMALFGDPHLAYIRAQSRS